MPIDFESKLCISRQEQSEVLNLLPYTFKTIVITYSSNATGTYIEIRTNIFNKEDALRWKEEFEEKTKTFYNQDSTYEENTKKTVFKRVYHCLHNTRPKSETKTPHYKHTKCRAKLIINVKQKGMKRSKDIYLKTFPCQISLRYEHNHFIDSTDTVPRKKPNSAVKEKFIELFSKGYSPSSALECFKMHLHKEHGDDYFRIVADGSKCPTRKWCYQLYYTIFKKEYRDPTHPGMLEAPKDMACIDNTTEDDNRAGGKNISMKQFEETQTNFETAVNVILGKFMQNPCTYVEPINKFCELVSQIKTDSTMISALLTFGKYQDIRLEKKYQGSRIIEKKMVCSKVPIESKNVIRPSKEHAYNKRKRMTIIGLPYSKKQYTTRILHVKKSTL